MEQFFSQPSNLQLLEEFLRPRIAAGTSPSSFFHTADVYAVPPEALTSKYAPVTSRDGVTCWYFFSILRDKSSRDRRTRRQVASSGKWHGEDREQPVLAGRGGVKIGYRKSFSFARTEKGKLVRLGWIMSELGFSDGEGGREGRERVVLCKVYRTPRSAHAPARSSESAVEGSPRPPVEGPPGAKKSVKTASTGGDPPQHQPTQAMGTDSADPSRPCGRHPRSDHEEGEFVGSDLEEGEFVGSDLEEGEFVASDDESAVYDGDSRYVVQHRHGNDARPEIEARRLEGVVVDRGHKTGADQVVDVHPPCSLQFLQGHKPAASQIVVTEGQQLSEAAPPQFVVHQPAAPLGHMSRWNNEPAAGGLHLGVGDACKHCRRAFTLGLQLGTRKVILKKGDARPKVSTRELAPVPALSRQMPPAAMEVAPAQRAVNPGMPRVVRLFGVNIVPGEPPASVPEEVHQNSVHSSSTYPAADRPSQSQRSRQLTSSRDTRILMQSRERPDQIT